MPATSGSASPSWRNIGGRRLRSPEFAALEASDVRAFMAMRRADDIAGRSLMRALAGLRSFAPLPRTRGQRQGRRARPRSAHRKSPRACRSRSRWTAAKRLADADERAGEERETWILVRDAAVMALLYGSGLRISEALGLKRRDVPKPGEGDVLVVTGKGNKTRMVPVLQNVLRLIADYVAIVPASARPTGPMFVGARGGLLSARASSSSPWSGCAARSA